MLVCHLQIDKKDGLILAVYKEPSKDPIYGVRITGANIEEALEKGIKYQWRMDALFRIDKIEEDGRKTFEIDPFD